MLQTKFSSVRYKNRPVLRRPSFRDDSLVALRYEKTVAAEPPVPIQPGNPRRIVRSPSSVSRASSSSSASSASPSPSVTSSSPSSVTLHFRGPIVIAPPAEQHPALRPTRPKSSPPSPSAARPSSCHGDWRRDSGLATTPTSSSPTIPEEECEDDAFSLAKIDELANTVVVSPPVQLGEEHQNSVKSAPNDDASVYSDHEPRESLALVGANLRGCVSHEGGQTSRATADAHVTANAMVDTKLAGHGAHAVGVACANYTPQNGLEGSCSPTPPPPRPIPISAPLNQSASWSKDTPVAHSSGTSSLAKSFSFRSITRIRSTRTSITCEPESSGAIHSPVPASTKGSTRPRMGHGASPNEVAPAPGPSPPPSPGLSRTPKSPKSPLSSRFWTRPKSPDADADALSIASSTLSDAARFPALAISIPSESLLEDDFLKALSFSKRGSIMFGGQRPARPRDGAMDDADNEDPFASTSANGHLQNEHTKTAEAPHTPTTSRDATQLTGPSQSHLHSQSEGAPDANRSQPEPEPEPVNVATNPTAVPMPDIRVVEPDVEMESQKVRSLYSVGWEKAERPRSQRERAATSLKVALEGMETTEEDEEKDDVPSLGRLRLGSGTPKSASSYSLPGDIGAAGTFDDLDEVDEAYVDRYGFITETKPHSRLGTPSELTSAQPSPRRRNVLQKRDPAGLSSPLAGRRTPSRKVSARSLNTQASEVSVTSFRSSRSVIRQAGNLLPHNRGRRWMDEAGDMLTVSPSLQDIAEEIRVEQISEAVKRKEWERSEKWRRMAKVHKGPQGQGMDFEFDVRNPKLIERTWKGIPDRWRAAAWWSFLATSAQNTKGMASDGDIIADFHRLQARSSPDDVQIDLDVPRTIGRHVMFRKRYRGGQRLMFRVLHALSIYFPQTGYVQGMASLAATLLCYFDEEKCFVMLVRMWQLRGLDRLYRPGFEGLLTALQEFEGSWLDKDVAKKLEELSVDATAYGTRWYLTLFNLSIPFPAQLRVWDVFLLLGEGAQNVGRPRTPVAKGAQEVAGSAEPTGLDVLHAASAALIQALREVIVDSDFENAMKALTSWISIKDEDLLMKVTKAEWKSHQGKRKG